jgi:nitrogen regulatory protein PII
MTGEHHGLKEALQNLHVPGLTVTPVTGFGEYGNPFKHDWTSRHVRIVPTFAAPVAEFICATSSFSF